jgi:hypothetical protein
LDFVKEGELPSVLFFPHKLQWPAKKAAPVKVRLKVTEASVLSGSVAAPEYR